MYLTLPAGLTHSLDTNTPCLRPQTEGIAFFVGKTRELKEKQLYNAIITENNSAQTE